MIDRFKIFKKKEEPIIDEIKVVDTGNKRAEDFDTVVVIVLDLVWILFVL